MNAWRVDRCVRVLSDPASRRQTIVAAFLGGLALLRRGHEAMAKKKRRKKKIKKNDFGCVNVGGFCKNNGQCCSGICKGKKGKNLHLRKCQAHDASTCAGQGGCAGEGVPCSTVEFTGSCAVTTGNGSYCAVSKECVACAKDTDCEALCGAGAACIVCAECVVAGLQTACASTTEEGCQPG